MKKIILKTLCAAFAAALIASNFLVVSFAADRRIDHQRIVSVAEPYPHRWTHHVLVTCPEDIDKRLLDWVEQAYIFTGNEH